MSFVRATFIVTVLAALSRVLGFARDLLLTQFLGAGPVADAFLAAFRLPNALRRIASEGGFNPAFIPHYLKLKERSEEDAKNFVRRAALIWGGLLVLVTVMAEFAAVPVMAVLAGGLEGEAFQLAVLYFRLLFPLVFGSGLASLLAAILNAEKRVIATSLAPLVCNLTIIAAITVSQVAHLDSMQGGYATALATGLSGFLHLAIVALALRDAGLMGSLRALVAGGFGAGTGLRRFSRSALPVLVAAGATQLFPVAAALVASHIPSAVSWFYYADRLFQLPAGFIAAASGIVLLPTIARHFARNDRRACILAQNRALEGALLFSLPAAAALAYLSLPITVVLFQRGAFFERDSQFTAAMLFLLSLSLPAAVMAKIFSNAAFALGRARFAVAAGITGFVATLAAATFATWLYGAPGVAVGAVGGTLAHFLLLAWLLWASGLWRPDRRLAQRALRIVVSTAIMILTLAALSHVADPGKVAGLALHCSAGLVVYTAAAWLSGVVSRRDLQRYLRR